MHPVSFPYPGSSVCMLWSSYCSKGPELGRGSESESSNNLIILTKILISSVCLCVCVLSHV